MPMAHWGQMIKLKMSGTLANTGGAEREREESIRERNIRVDTGVGFGLIRGLVLVWFWFSWLARFGWLVGWPVGNRMPVGWKVAVCFFYI